MNIIWNRKIWGPPEEWVFPSLLSKNNCIVTNHEVALSYEDQTLSNANTEHFGDEEKSRNVDTSEN